MLTNKQIIDLREILRGSLTAYYGNTVEAKSKKDTVIGGSFTRLINQRFDITNKEQTKTFITCINNKRWILDDNEHILAFGLYRVSDV